MGEKVTHKSDIGNRSNGGLKREVRTFPNVSEKKEVTSLQKRNPKKESYEVISEGMKDPTIKIQNVFCPFVLVASSEE